MSDTDLKIGGTTPEPPPKPAGTEATSSSSANREPMPNVRLASSKKSEALPEGLCNIGMGSVTIPSSEKQLAGFYVEDPGLLVAQFPQYKFVQEKGRPHNQTVTL